MNAAHMPRAHHDGTGWRAVCPCGWRSPAYKRTGPANSAAHRHTAATLAQRAGDAGGHRCHMRPDGRTVCDGCGWVSAEPGAAGVLASFDHPAAVCRECWHEHAGPELGGICIGCACPPYGPPAW